MERTIVIALDNAHKEIFFIQPEPSATRSVVIGENEKRVFVEMQNKAGLIRAKESETNIRVKRGASIQYVCIFSDKVTEDIAEKRSITLEDNARAEFYVFYFGGNTVNVTTHVSISAHCHALFNVCFFSSADQKFAIQETYTLEGQESFLRSYVRGLVSEQSETDYRGNIHVTKRAQRSDSRLEVRSFVVGGRAKSNIVPQLSIEANNVKAGHAASVSTIQDDELFYLRSRGVRTHQAIELLVEGVFFEAARGIRNTEAKDMIMNMAKKKFSRAALS